MVALCKDFPREFRVPEAVILSDANIRRLQEEGLLYVSRDGRYYRVSRLGYDLLQVPASAFRRMSAGSRIRLCLIVVMGGSGFVYVSDPLNLLAAVNNPAGDGHPGVRVRDTFV